MGITPLRNIPSSVKVPVLSKQIVSTLPDIMILGGATQKIYSFLSLEIAKLMPKFIAAGSAGEIVIVTNESKVQMILNKLSFTSLINPGRRKKNPMKVIEPRIRRN